MVTVGLVPYNNTWVDGKHNRWPTRLINTIVIASGSYLSGNIAFSLKEYNQYLYKKYQSSENQQQCNMLANFCVHYFL